MSLTFTKYLDEKHFNYSTSQQYFVASIRVRFQEYPNQSGIPTFLCSLMSSVIRVSVSTADAKQVSRAKHSVEFPQSIRSQEKPGLLLSALIILHQSNVDRLLFKKESGKTRITINRVCLAIPKRATITWKKLRSQYKFPV